MQVISRSLCVFFMCVPFVGDALAQSNLPTQVRADMLKTQVVDSVGKGDAQTALKAIAEYRSLGVEVPTPLLFLEAELSSAQKDYLRAQTALEAYFKQAKSGDDRYSEALRLFPNIKKSADEIRLRRAAEIEGARRRALEEARREAEPKIPTMIASIAANMATIKGGRFKMGGSGVWNNSEQDPIHLVTVRSFRLNKYEVTFDEYDLFAQATERKLPDGKERGKHPATDVSWDDAQAFVAWLNQVSGERYRLPSEAEWEYAARAGSTKDYPWGKIDFRKTNESDWGGYANGFGTTGPDRWIASAPVGSLLPNEFGLFDMVGNVSEWTVDCENGSYDGAPTDGSAWMSGDCSRRMLRGGSWMSSAIPLRVAARTWGSTKEGRNDSGFRLAQDL